MRFVPARRPKPGDSARKLGVTRERLSNMANKTMSTEAKKDEPERDIFCIVSDAFRCLAQRSSTLLGSAWACRGAVLVILVWRITVPTLHVLAAWQLIISTATTVA